jgi:signal peptidase I
VTLTEQGAVQASAQPVEAETAPPAPHKHAVLVEWIVIVVVALVAALLIKTFAIEAFYIPSSSMVPTLQVGDRVLVNKLAYDFHPVHQGDIVVFRRPPHDSSLGISDLIKRVVAGPGQTVYVANCAVYVDGKQMAQPYIPGWQNPSSPYCTTWPTSGCAGACLPNPYKVPQGYYFVMGDNRKDSYDSRYWGPLPASYIVGRAFVRMWPVSRVGFL